MIKKRYEPAYFTVEASLILPLVMLFTTMMVFLAFYSYDRCVLEHSAYEAAVRGTANHIQTAQEAEAEVRIAAGRLIEGKLFAFKDFNYDISVDADKITVTYHCTVNMPFITWLEEYISGIDMSMDISRSANKCRQTRMIRDCRILHKMIEK